MTDFVRVKLESGCTTHFNKRHIIEAMNLGNGKYRLSVQKGSGYIEHEVTDAFGRIIRALIET